jgi:thiol-disulfide isomerase/thioredoxin
MGVCIIGMFRTKEIFEINNNKMNNKMNIFNSPNVYYLEEQDFVNGVLVGDGQLFNGLTIVLVQSNSCGYCAELKPVFQTLADSYASPPPSPPLTFATIQVDSTNPSEQAFRGPLLTTILGGDPLRGVPLLIKLYKGRIVDKYTGSRDMNSIAEWVWS